MSEGILMFMASFGVHEMSAVEAFVVTKRRLAIRSDVMRIFSRFIGNSCADDKDFIF
jgi:hypothetical protein